MAVLGALQLRGETAFVADGGAESPFFFSTAFSAWKVSVIARRPSVKVGSPWARS